MTRKRVQLDFTVDGFEKLKTIRERSNSQTNAETVRRALKIYEWFLDNRDAGRRMQVIDGNKVISVDLLV